MACRRITVLLSACAVATASDHGCYDVKNTHTCDCDISEKACTGDVGIWTSGCSCDNSKDPNGGGSTTVSPSHPDHGCYNVGDLHRCDCKGYTKTTCEAAQGLWITGCKCATEALPPPSPAPPPPGDMGTVVVTMAAVCPVSVYKGTFIETNMKKFMTEIASVESSQLRLLILDKCSPDLYSRRRFLSMSSPHVELIFTIDTESQHQTDMVNRLVFDALSTAADASVKLGATITSIPVITGTYASSTTPYIVTIVVVSVLGGIAVLVAIWALKRKMSGQPIFWNLSAPLNPAAQPSRGGNTIGLSTPTRGPVAPHVNRGTAV